MNQNNHFEEAIDASEPEPPETTEPADSLESTVTISVDEGIDSVDVPWLLEHSLLVLDCIEKTNSTITIRVVNDEAMQALHKTHSGLPETTDVLTFNHEETVLDIEADIAICQDVARRMANERGHSVNAELLLYIVHGILHCAGHDDHQEEAHKKMHDEEDRILTAIGVGPVWSCQS